VVNVHGMNSDGANSEPHPALPAGGQWYTHAPNTTVEIIMSPAVDVSSSTHSSLCFDFPVVSDAELSTLAETYVTMIQENDSTRLSAIPVRQRLLTNISEGLPFRYLFDCHCILSILICRCHLSI
jgi:hypothetical protein